MKTIFKPEDNRRSVNASFDSAPSYGHKFNFEFSKKFITNKVVLDIGCWTGQFERVAYKSTKKMFGIDPKDEAIGFAKKHLPQVNFLVAKANKLPFPNAYFDTILMMDVIEHLPRGSEKEVLDEIRRVIKPGGVLIISTPNKHFLSIMLDPAYFLIGHRHYSAAEMTTLLTSSKFKITEIRYAGNLVGLLLANFSYFLKYTMGFQPTYPQKVQDFFLREYQKKGFANIYIVSESLK